jgi:hypothetical protein
MASEALRVLALTISYQEGEIQEKNLIFVGLVGMVDPPRQAAKPAVATFKKGRHYDHHDHRRPQGHRLCDCEATRHRREARAMHVG